jgi:hypothetical protein
MMQYRSEHVYNLKTNDRNSSTSKKSNERETAQYIADLVLELRNLAKAYSFTALQGLLEVSYYEAFSAANKVEIPAGEIEHLQELSRAAAG